MSANDSELPLAKVGQRQTPHAYPLQLTLKGVFALKYLLILGYRALGFCGYGKLSQA